MLNTYHASGKNFTDDTKQLIRSGSTKTLLVVEHEARPVNYFTLGMSACSDTEEKLKDLFQHSPAPGSLAEQFQRFLPAYEKHWKYVPDRCSDKLMVYMIRCENGKILDGKYVASTIEELKREIQKTAEKQIERSE